MTRFEEIYRILFTYLEAVQLVSSHGENAYLRALAIIIEEDLFALIEECKAILESNEIPQQNIIDDFISRSATVAEEADYLLSRDDIMVSLRKPNRKCVGA